MRPVEPGKPKARIRETPEGLEVWIPSKKNALPILFSVLWLIGWAIADYQVITEFLAGEASDPPGFALVWLLMWNLGGAYIIFVLIWWLFGSEEIVVTTEFLIVSRKILGFGLRKAYTLDLVKGLRHTPTSEQSQFARVWNIRGGLIAFDYGASTVRFGQGLSEAEVEQVVATLKARLG